MSSNPLQQLYIKKIIERIIENAKLIGCYVEEDDPKADNELQEMDQEELLQYFLMRQECLKLLIDKDTIH